MTERPLTEREELASILGEALWGTKIYFKESPHGADVTLADRLMSWHTTHCPQMSREAVEKVLDEHGIGATPRCVCTLTHRGKILTDLLRLLNGEPREWCRDIRQCKGNWYFDDSGYTRPVSEIWTVCPICQTPRPTQ